MGSDQLDRVELVRVRRKPEHGRPVPGRDQFGHHGADVGIQVIPHDDDGVGELLVRVVKEPGVVGLGEPLALAGAVPAPLVDAVDQPGDPPR